MNETINLVDILKDCPKGTKLYSVIYGEVEFEHIQTDYNTDYHYNTDYPIVFKYKDEDDYDCIDSTTIDGKQVCFANGECTLFPIKRPT